jgi:hypothetical protein
MSTLNQLTAIDKTLLTDLTAEQSAIVEGGKTLTINRIEAVNAGADFAGADETYIKVDSTKIWGVTSMSDGSVKSVNFTKDFTYSASIALFDEDWGPDDYMGGFSVSSLTNGEAVRQVSGSGSTYNIYYSVTA